MSILSRTLNFLCFKLNSIARRIMVPIVIRKYSGPANLNIEDGFKILIQINRKNKIANDLSVENAIIKGPVILKDFPSDRIIIEAPKVSGRFPFVAEVENALLLGDPPIAFTRTFKLITESIDYNTFDNRLKKSLQNNFFFFDLIFLCFRVWRSIFRPQQILESATLLFSKWNHYGHWLPEHLLKIRYIDEYEKQTGRRPKIILEKNAPKWKLHILSKLGYQETDIFFWNSKLTLVNNLVLPSYPEPNIEDFNWLQHKLTSDLNFNVEDEFAGIYLSRQKCSTRKIINESHVITLLNKYGIKTIIPEDLSIDQQLGLFTNSKIIIGAHGSAFTNIIFSKDATVIEIFGKHVPLFFYRLSLVMGHNYVPFFCDYNSNIAKRINSDIDLYVDINKLDQHLRNCGLSQISTNR